MSKKPIINMKELADRFRYRLALDSSYQAGEDKAWYWQFPGRNGHVWVYGADQLAAYTHSTQVGHKLEAVPGARVVQRGDREMSLTFPIDRLPAVADLLKLRRKRTLTDEQRVHLREASEKGRANSPIGHKRSENPNPGESAPGG